MPLHLHRLLPSLLALGPSAAAADAAAPAEAVDLFVRERYRTPDGAPCDSCGELDDGSCVLETLNFYPEGHCRSRGGGKSWVYGTLDDGRILCRQTLNVPCEDEAAAVFTATSEAECGQAWTLGECSDLALRATKLAGWCVQSPEPAGEYVVPLVDVRSYSEGCPASDYRNLYRPARAGLCVRGGGMEGTARSRIDACDGDGALRSARYDSSGCDGPAKPVRFDGATGECPSEPAEGTGSYNYHTSDCGSPGYHCKELEMESVLGESPPAAAAAEDPSMVEDTSATEAAEDPPIVEDPPSATSATAAAGGGGATGVAEDPPSATSATAAAGGEGAADTGEDPPTATSATAAARGEAPADAPTPPSPSEPSADPPTAAPTLDQESNGGASASVGVAVQSAIAALGATVYV